MMKKTNKHNTFSLLFLLKLLLFYNGPTVIKELCPIIFFFSLLPYYKYYKLAPFFYAV